MGLSGDTGVRASVSVGVGFSVDVGVGFQVGVGADYLYSRVSQRRCCPGFLLAVAFAGTVSLDVRRSVSAGISCSGDIARKGVSVGVGLGSTSSPPPSSSQASSRARRLSRVAARALETASAEEFAL